MLAMLVDRWWVVGLRGLSAVLFGIAALIWPGLTLLTLVWVFGLYALADGVFGVFHGIRSYGERERWWVIVLEGVISFLAGIVAIIWPGITALTLLYVIAVWAIVKGILEIVGAIQLRKVIEGEWMLILSGLVSAVLGVLLILFPGEGVLSLTWLIGIYALLFGVLFIILAFRLRSMRT